MNIREVPEGELVLIVTKKKTEALTLGIAAGTTEHDHRAFAEKRKDLKINQPVRLRPGNIVLDNKEYPSATPIGHTDSFWEESISELILGKDEVVKYLSQRTDFSLHAQTIAKINKPYRQNMLKIKTAAYIA